MNSHDPPPPVLSDESITSVTEYLVSDLDSLTIISAEMNDYRQL